MHQYLGLFILIGSDEDMQSSFDISVRLDDASDQTVVQVMINCRAAMHWSPDKMVQFTHSELYNREMHWSENYGVWAFV